MWAIESIPNQDSLFYRIHQCHIRSRNHKLKPKVFKEHGEGEERGMSTDWEKYSIAADTRNRTEKPPTLYGVVSMFAGFLRELKLTVNHDPIENHPDLGDNRAHTNVTGIDGMDVEVRLKLLKHIKWEIDPPVEVDKSNCRV